MSVTGEIDFVNSAAMADVMATLLERDPGEVVVDVHDLHFADAASLTVFLASCRALRGGGSPVFIAGASADARRACHAAGLGALLVDG